MRIGINAKIVGSFMAGTMFALLFIGWSYFVIWGLLGTVRDVDTISSRLEITGELSFQVQKLLRVSGDYLATGDVGKRGEFDGLITDMSALLRRLEAHGDGEKWINTLASVKDGVGRLGEMTAGLMSVDDPVGNPLAAVFMDDATALAEGVMKGAEEFHRLTEEERKAMAVEAERRADQTVVFFFVFLGVGAVSLAALYLYLRRHITGPLLAFHEGADVISKGEFSYRVDVTTGDEIEDLAGGFNRMAAALEEREKKLLSLIKVVDKMNEDLMRASRYKADFLSHMSHELKTPLTHIMGFSELLKLRSGNDLPEPSRKYVDIICGSGKELLKLINNLLDFTDDMDSEVLDVREFDLKAAVEEAVEGVRTVVDRQEQTLDVDVDKDIGLFKADAGMFKEMVANLLSNALKSNPKGGTVTLKVSRSRDEYGGPLRVSVTDSGPGLNPEEIEAAFNPFGSGDGLPPARYDTGIGLALTKRFVEFHGGKIWGESGDGGGSTFIFTLPSGRVKDKKAEAVEEDED
ncbi:MAG: ATP-binding protein [Thermodesulfobacteriota bacterium]